jgi:TIR domain
MAKRSVKNSPMVFISYRREDTGGDAGRLNDTLTQFLGPGRTFWDLEKIAPGKDFRKELKRVLGGSDILLALIGPRWETITDANGRPRLCNKDDLVRMELLAGLRHKTVRVVPILLNRETIPKASDLPSVLRSVIKRNEFTIRRDRWRQDVEELLKRLGISGQQTTARVADGSNSRQASFVSLSVEWKRTSVPDSTPRRWVVYVDNASDAPITVEQVVVTSPGTELSIDWGTVRPEVTSDYELDDADFDPSGDPPEVSMRFLDADGQRWTWRKGEVKAVKRIRGTSSK